MRLAIKRKDNQDIILEDILLPSAEKRFINTDLAIPIGFTYKRELTSKIFVNVGCEYLLGLRNAFSKIGASGYGILTVFNNSKQNRIALNIGIGINLTK